MSVHKAAEYFKYQHHAITPLGARWQFKAPAAAMIGWIPFGDSPAESPLSAGAQEAQESLLSTGNDPPPRSFTGPGDLSAFVARKDYRAVVAVDSITVTMSGAGAFTAVSFYHLIRCGYTPLPPGHRAFHWGGQHFGRPRTLITSDEIRIRLLIWFKLGKLTSLAARALSGYWPASANGEIEVVISRNPLSVSIDFMGSCVPSQQHYVDWGSVGDGYDMLKEEPRKFEEFLELGYCNDALSWSRTRVRISEEDLNVVAVRD